MFLLLHGVTQSDGGLLLWLAWCSDQLERGGLGARPKEFGLLVHLGIARALGTPASPDRAVAAAGTIAAGVSGRSPAGRHAVMAVKGDW